MVITRLNKSLYIIGLSYNFSLKFFVVNFRGLSIYMEQYGSFVAFLHKFFEVSFSTTNQGF